MNPNIPTPEVLTYLSKENIGVVSVLLENGSIHAATVHYSYKTEPFKIYIHTPGTTVKAQPFLSGKTGPCAFVVGFSEKEWITLQMRGEMRMVTDQESNDPEKICLEFTPTWWRYTDFKKGK